MLARNLRNEENKMKKIGLYLHFPFCEQKCRYCDFSSWAGKEKQMDAYLDALFQELDSHKGDNQDVEISSIFMGGGTPTLFHGELLVKTLEKCKEYFDVLEDAEISIECNPGTVDKEKLSTLLEGGFNRLSLGLQAWQDHHLDFLGRIHRHKEFEDSVKWALEAGFTNISADLIFGIPGQSVEEWQESIEKATATGINHISAYSLKVEEDTVLYHWKAQGRFQEMDDEQERGLYHSGVHLLEERGFKQYEISNFAQAGYESRHNLNYWKNGEYIGFGCGAHSYYKSLRRANVQSVEEYIQRINVGHSVIASQEEIDNETEVFETLMLAFRLNEGINKQGFASRFGFSLTDKYANHIEELKKQGLVVEDEHSIRPTALGFDFENRIALTFLD